MKKKNVLVYFLIISEKEFKDKNPSLYPYWGMGQSGNCRRMSEKEFKYKNSSLYPYWGKDPSRYCIKIKKKSNI